MLHALKIIGIVLLAALLLVVAYGFYRTWKTGRGADYISFTATAVPTTLPEGGLWSGSADELGEVSWKGKKFLDERHGINLFEKDGVTREAYPFVFSETDSIGWSNKKVITLDYNQQGNPLWLRFIADEMVSVGPNEYLGVVYIKLIPGFPFRMGYFRLKQ